MKYFVALFVALAPVVAHAGPGLWDIPAPGDGIVRATVESDLGRHHAFEPVTLAPDILVGIARDVALLVSSSRASAGRTGAGNGICLVGPHESLDPMPPVCSEYARGFGARVSRRFVRHLDLQAGIEMPSSSPFTLAATTGVLASLTSGRWWLRAAPSVMVGLVNRGDGNEERVLFPVYAGASVSRLDVHVHTGAESAVATISDTLAIPVGLGATLDLGRAHVGVEASFDHALGPQNNLARRSAAFFIQLPIDRSSR